MGKVQRQLFPDPAMQVDVGDDGDYEDQAADDDSARRFEPQQGAKA